MSVLPEDIKINIQTLYSDFLSSRALRPRLGQKQMIAEIAKLLVTAEEDDNPSISCIEAGTGTGKTLAYLTGTLPITLKRNQTLVISTATVALQSQLVEKDLPDFMDATGLMMTWALAKGRRRYLCPTSLELAVDAMDNSDVIFPDELAKVFDHEDKKMVLSLNDAWTAGQWLGDMDQIPHFLSNEVRIALTTDHQRCQGRSCRNFNICPYYRERELWEAADILIVNHDLLISDIKLGGGIILPPLGSIALVIDEAHQLPRIASDQFTKHIRIGQSLGAIKTVDRVCQVIQNNLDPDHRLQKTLNEMPKLLEDLGHLLVNWAREFLSALAKMDDSVFTFHSNWTRYRLNINERYSPPESKSETPKSIIANLNKIQDWLKQLSNGERAEVPDTDTEVLSQQMGIALARLENIPAIIRVFSEEQSIKALARWIRVGQDLRYATPDDPTDVEFWVSPITPADSLKDTLWKSVRSAVLTSATMTHELSFKALTDCLGILDYQSLIVESIFDYSLQGRLVVPQLAGDPKNEEQHACRIAKYLETRRGSMTGVLVLFTSWRLLNCVEKKLSDELLASVLIQGQLSLSRLMQLHKKRRKDNDFSMIFGLQSMAEGIDLPGDLANEVIITRLPFQPPDDPREATHAEYLQSLGKDSFKEIAMPMATIRLRQAVGRLIRSETDTGQVTVLDQRLVNTSWGRSLIRELPSFQFEKDSE